MSSRDGGLGEAFAQVGVALSGLIVKLVCDQRDTLAMVTVVPLGQLVLQRKDLASGFCGGPVGAGLSGGANRVKGENGAGEQAQEKQHRSVLAWGEQGRLAVVGCGSLGGWLLSLSPATMVGPELMFAACVLACIDQCAEVVKRWALWLAHENRCWLEDKRRGLRKTVTRAAPRIAITAWPIMLSLDQ
jgi:hypothetical protein